VIKYRFQGAGLIAGLVVGSSSIAPLFCRYPKGCIAKIPITLDSINHQQRGGQMGTFESTDFGVSQMDRDTLDRIALNGGTLGAIGYSYATNSVTPPPRHGYGFAWIDRRGMGNHGRLVLVPRSDRAAEYLRQGKVKIFMEDYDLSYQEADALYSATQGVERGLESAVLDYAIETRDCVYAWAHFPFEDHRVRVWLAEWSMPETSLSVPRIFAVAEIMRNWRHG